MQHTAALQTFIFGDKIVEIFVPDQKQVKENYSLNSTSFSSPYWAKVWPASIALCTFLQSNLHYIIDKKLLELAAGLALPGIFCAAYAKEICISDIEPAAIEIMRISILHNNLKNSIAEVIDWSNFQTIAIPEVLLLSDINYEPAQFEVLSNLIRHFLNHNCTIILSTPQRLIGRDFINKLLQFCKEQTAENVDYEGTPVAVSIFVLKS